MSLRSTFALVAIGLIVVTEPWNATARDVGGNTAILDGTWIFTYSCTGMTGLYADRCAKGDRDFFILSVGHINHKVCGAYEETAQFGNHVDDGDLDDWTFTSDTQNSFRVGFHFTGNIGQAMVTVTRDKLVWRVLNKQPAAEGGSYTWLFSPPTFAVLTRQVPNQGNYPGSCRK